MLGPLAIRRDGRALVLPASRKVRALFAYLALAPLPVSRSQLCELLWDVPNDPRGELRWCLSKIRGLVDGPGRRRVETRDDTIRLDLTDCFVDALEIARAAEAGIDALASERQQALTTLFNGDFLEGLEIDRSPAFNGWLTAQRRRLRGSRSPSSSISRGALPTRRSATSRSGWSLRPSTGGRTRYYWPRSPATGGSGKARSISPLPRGSSKTKGSIVPRCAKSGARSARRKQSRRKIGPHLRRPWRQRTTIATPPALRLAAPPLQSCRSWTRPPASLRGAVPPMRSPTT